MTIELKYNFSVQVVLWLKLPISNEYILECTNKFTNETYSTIIENISGSINQYGLFNIVMLDTQPNVISKNVIYLPKKGEYSYKIYIDLSPNNNLLVGEGLLISEFSENNQTEYQNDNKMITYGN